MFNDMLHIGHSTKSIYYLIIITNLFNLGT